MRVSLLLVCHVLPTPSDAGIHDCVVVQELLKEVAQSHTLDPTGQKDFKGILIVQKFACVSKRD